MEITFLVVVILLGIINAFFLYFLWNKKPQKDNNVAQILLQQLNDLRSNLDQKIGASSKEVSDSLKYQTKEISESFKHQSGQNQKIIRDITERLTKLDEANSRVVGLGDNIKELQNILKNPKQRGILGEYFLETLLKNAMPPGSYKMQYNLGKNEEGSGDVVVDAVVFVKEKIIPVDSKFSLENYNRMAEERDSVRKADLQKVFVNDLKERIKETSKYIKPEKGTMEFAFMFIPHEAIYYDLLINKIGDPTAKDNENLIERAARQFKVIIVSPTSFLAYLQTVLQGLKALQIEEETKDIIKNVTKLGAHISRQDDFMNKLGKSLGTTVNHYEKAYKELKKVDKDVVKISGKGGGVEVLSIEKPEVE